MHSPSHIALSAGGDLALNYRVLVDLDERFRMMDEFAGYCQVISGAGPPPEVVAPDASVELARILNDELAGLVAAHPDRFLGAVASLPMNDPDAACRELERALTVLKLNGVQIYTNVEGKPLDLPEFRPIFQMIAASGRPVLLHPARARTHADYASETASRYLTWQIFGWPYESTAAMMRLVFSGIMEALPSLEILVHHAGAMVPFFHGRMRALFELFGGVIAAEGAPPLPRPAIEYFQRFNADTSVYTAGSVVCACEFMGPGRVVFGTDAPYDATGGRYSVAESRAAVTAACSEADRRAIFSGNAERLFGLGVPS
jgi:aminocarboxymuconate-semialdehyde decarboxylase